jgi:hypothetical protein
MKWVLGVAFLAVWGCGHDARFVGTWYRAIPLALRLEPDGAASFEASRPEAPRRPAARGTWAASDGQILVVIPRGGCVGVPAAGATFFSLRFVGPEIVSPAGAASPGFVSPGLPEGTPPRLRVELVSLGGCPVLETAVAEEYVLAPGSRATAPRPVGDWRKVDTHIAQGAVARLEEDGRYAILLPRYTQQGTSDGIGYTAITAGSWSSQSDVVELVEAHETWSTSRSRSSHWRWLPDGAHGVAWAAQPDTREELRDLAGPGWIRVPSLAEGADPAPGPEAADGTGSVVGRWRVPLDPRLRLGADGDFAVSLTDLDGEALMRGSWQARGGERAGVHLRSWRGACAAEPTVVTELTLVPQAGGALTSQPGVHGCERFGPLRAQALRDLVRVTPGQGDAASPWAGDWHSQATLAWIVALFAGGQYEVVLPVGDETRILAFGTWALAGDQLILREQAGFCQRRPEDVVGAYTVDLRTLGAADPILHLRRSHDACPLRAPLDGARATPWRPSADHPFRDATFDGQ